MGKSHQQCPENKDGSSEAQKWFSTNATLPEKECPRKERVFTTGDCRTQKNQPTQPQQQCIQNQHWTSIPRQQKSRWGAWENQDRGLAPDDMAQVSFFLLISLRPNHLWGPPAHILPSQDTKRTSQQGKLELSQSPCPLNCSISEAHRGTFSIFLR